MNHSDRSILRQRWSPRSPTGVSTSGLRKEVMLPMHMDAVEMNRVWGCAGILPLMTTACAGCSGEESLQGELCCCHASWCELYGCCWATWAALAAMPVTSSFYNICILACLSCSPGFSAALPWKHNLPGCCSATGECGEVCGGTFPGDCRGDSHQEHNFAVGQLCLSKGHHRQLGRDRRLPPAASNHFDQAYAVPIKPLQNTHPFPSEFLLRQWRKRDDPRAWLMCS